MIWPWLLGAVWLVCAILTFGALFAFLQREYPGFARKERTADRLMSLMVASLGPIGLVFSLSMAEGWRHGLYWGLPRWTKSLWVWSTIVGVAGFLCLFFAPLWWPLALIALVAFVMSYFLGKGDKVYGSRQGSQNPHGGTGGVAPTAPHFHTAPSRHSFPPGTLFNPNPGQLVKVIQFGANPSALKSGQSLVVDPTIIGGKIQGLYQPGDVVYDNTGNLLGIVQPDMSVSRQGVFSAIAQSEPVLTPHVEHGLVAGPIIAYRTWEVRNDVLFGVGMGAEVCWKPLTPLKARHVDGTTSSHPDNPCPYERCKCGIYALKTLAGVTEKSDVIGKVALWGKVIEHEHGYRAEYAYPLAFFVPKAPMPGFPVNTSMGELAKRYGITVEVME